ncbi:hypothetical protein ABIE91_001725 [Bradyrhizobium elkanii]
MRKPRRPAVKCAIARFLVAHGAGQQAAGVARPGSASLGRRAHPCRHPDVWPRQHRCPADLRALSLMIAPALGNIAVSWCRQYRGLDRQTKPPTSETAVDGADRVPLVASRPLGYAGPWRDQGERRTSHRRRRGRKPSRSRCGFILWRRRSWCSRRSDRKRGAGVAIGSGGGGAASGGNPFASGAAGATCYAIITSPAASYTYTVGSAGSGGTGTQVGGAGANGAIKVIEHYGT